MSNALSFTEIAEQRVELLPDRTVLTTIGDDAYSGGYGDDGGPGGDGGTGGDGEGGDGGDANAVVAGKNYGDGTQVNIAIGGFGGPGGDGYGGSADGGEGGEGGDDFNF